MSCNVGCTQMLSNGYHKIAELGESAVRKIQEFSAEKIKTVVKTNNFALVIFAAGFVGLGLHLAAASIPAYLYMGVMAGVVIHLAKDEIREQLIAKWDAGKWTELAISIIGLCAASWYLPMTSICTTVTVICADPSAIVRAISNLKSSSSAPQE